MRIDRSSYGSLALVYGISAVLAAVLLIWVRTPWICWPLLAFLLWFCAWQTAFFRIPDRKRSGGEKSVTSVADGRVVLIERVFEGEFLHRECMQVSVYMNFFDVHANFWPVDGTVTYYKYHPGKHLFAFKPKASEDNEHSCVCLRTVGGKDVFFKQLAGVFARRIVCYAEPEKAVQGGKQCGIIKFGSRIDMLLPLDADIKVRVGDIARACETVIAEL